MFLPRNPTSARHLAQVLIAASLASTPLVGCKSAKPGPLGLDRRECAWVFTEYQPSEWEREWSTGEESGERRDRECEILATPTEADRSVRLIRSIRDLVEKRIIPADSIGLFSRMAYSQVCGISERKTGRKRVQLIEPLVGIIRDPLSICPKPPSVPDDVYRTYGLFENDEQSKRHLLIGPAAPWTDRPSDPRSWRLGGFEPWTKETPDAQKTRVRQNMLIDMGASTYGAWQGREYAVGARWFVDRYQKSQMSFDWIVSYEYQKMDPGEIYASVPPDVLPHYIYYNQGVEKAPEGKWNPWRILRGMGVTRSDYVVAKLDIDTPDIENDLANQVLTDPRITVLVDEFFYEHHVNTKAMNRAWETQNSPILLRDTYRTFAALRAKGIRMHSWP
jgi:hypothetical protein